MKPTEGTLISRSARMCKACYSITNCFQYNKYQIYRSALTFWVDTAVMNCWLHHDHHEQRGLSQLYTDQTICTLKDMPSLTLQATQGLFGSLFGLMDVPRCVPDYSSVSKCVRTEKVASMPTRRRTVTPTRASANFTQNPQ